MENLAYFINKIDPKFLEIDETPLFEFKKVHLDIIENYLEKEFSLDEDIKIEVSNHHFENREKELNEFSSDLKQLCISMPPLSGNVYFFLANEDIKKLTAKILTKEKGLSFVTPSLEEGFYKYIILKSLKGLKEIDLFKPFSLKIVDDVKMVSEEAFFIDVNILIGDIALVGKIAILEDFRRSINEYFLSSRRKIDFSTKNKEIKLPLSIDAGYTTLDLEEYKTLEKGDFILLDRGNINLHEKKADITLKISSKPIFLAKLNKNKIHILEYANFYEENMDKDDINIDNMGDVFDEEDNQNMDIENENTLEKEETNTEDLEKKEEMIKEIEKTTVKLNIEIAKLNITLEKLTKLQPGNMLPLGVTLENPISLTLNGNKVASGELIMLGDKLGIKILEIN